MKCHYHPALDSVSDCLVCRKLLCVSCSHSIKGKVYCQDCLVAGAELAALALHPRIATYSPRRAAFFALLPGIGAVYNRQYLKAMVHFSVWLGLMMVADEGPDVFGVAAVAFWVFTIIDAYRSAQAILRRRVSQPELLEEDAAEAINAPIWGTILILLGIVFFLHNVGAISLNAAARFWPLSFVALGVYLILDYFLRSRKPASPGSVVIQGEKEKETQL